MKKLLKSKKIYKNLLFVAIFAYVLYIFIGQQKTLNSYKNTNEYYTEQINKQTPHNNAQAQKKAQPTPKKQAAKKQNDRNGAPKHTAKKKPKWQAGTIPSKNG